MNFRKLLIVAIVVALPCGIQAQTYGQQYASSPSFTPVPYHNHPYISPAYADNRFAFRERELREFNPFFQQNKPPLVGAVVPTSANGNIAFPTVAQGKPSP